MGNFFVDYYGEDAQLEKLKEEAIELAHAIQRYQAGKGTMDEVKDEIADVSNISDCLQEHWGDGVVFKIICQKQRRQMERIKEEQKADSVQERNEK